MRRREAAEREVLEELGVRVSSGRLLCVDFKSANRERPACLQFVFDGGTLAAEDLARLKVEPEELEQWAAVAPDEAPGWAEAGGPASRLRLAIDVLCTGATLYLEDGQLIEAEKRP